VLLGPAATERSVYEAARRSGRIHLATYGVLNRHNPLFSYVALAPGGGHDGRLEVHEVAGLQLNAGLVVLSACETALGAGELSDVPAGDDWLGLVRTFLQAGADNVVATLWKVEDRATAQLMGSFYAGIAAGSGPSHALAVAQRHMISDPATMHPFFWASFVGVGIQ
jgi:CHAT domain-containing protein